MNVRRYFVLPLLCLSFLLSATVASAASPNIVISQAYGGGGATSGSPAYINDYVELFNTSGSAVTVAGYSLQYGSSTGNFGSSAANIYTIPAGTSIPAGGYLLVKLGGAGTVGATFTSDLTSGNLSMAAGSGKVALVTTGTALNCGATATPCTLPDARIIDLVSYGASNNAEGGASANNGSALDSTKGAVRKSSGCQDTDNNNSDFSVFTVATGLVPRTSASPTHSCGSGNNPPSITAPANPIATVATDSAPFNVSLSGSDDGSVYNWSATAGTGVTSVVVASGQGSANITYTVTIAAAYTGTASFTASLSDNVNTAVTRTVNIQVGAAPNAAPTITAPSNPIATVNQDAAPFPVSLTGSDDGGVYNWSATAGTGISAVSVSAGQGSANATFTVTLTAGYTGTATFTASLSDNVNTPATRTVNILVNAPPPVVPDHIVISQIYGAGGNTNAVYTNDYVELYNPTAVAVDVTGWTVQYASSTGSGWGGNSQPLAGEIGPGQYYLVGLAGGSVGTPLPTPNVPGEINMSGTTGKIALVSNGDPLSGNCPLSDPNLVDFLGYGTADCREGTANAPAPSTANALFRKSGGLVDANENSTDFITGAPSPRRTAPIVEIGPFVTGTDPFTNTSSAPRDANIQVNFNEPVDVDSNWFTIVCTTTGVHNDATLGGSGKFRVIVPNNSFINGEQCTVTILKNAVHDSDLDDSGPNSDTMRNDYVWTFSTSTGTPPPFPSSIHLAMGNPTDATPDINEPDNYLMEKPEFILSYNRDKGAPNWVSWHLATEWIGSLERVDTFRADPAVPSTWYRVLGTDFSNSGFDRGHMVPNADRDPETSPPINQATFLMTNMIAQAPDNNQGPWANMENSLRTLLGSNELYIVAGGAGSGGTGSNGPATTIANGHVNVPAQTWKVALVLPRGTTPENVTASTRTIAVLMPNVQGIRNNAWEGYLTSIDAIEELTGYDFFENVPDAVENSIEAGVNGTNPPGTASQSTSTREDNAKAITLQIANPTGNTLTYSIVTPPAHGTLIGTGSSRTYTPDAEYFGNDSFSFTVTDGARTSNTSTVSISVLEVNDTPTATADSKSTSEETPLTFPASDLTLNDSAGPSESTQTLTVTAVTATASTHGTVSLTSGNVTYTPAVDYSGPASFTYQVCDNGLTEGASDPRCATGTVNVVIDAGNDAPVVNLTAPASGFEGTQVSATISATDGDSDPLTVTWQVLKNGSPFSSGSGTSVTFTPNDNGSYTINASANDGKGGTDSDTRTVTVLNVAPSFVTITGPTTNIPLGSAATIQVSLSDPGSLDTHTLTLDWDDGTVTPVTCSVDRNCTSTRIYAATGVYGVSLTLTDNNGGTSNATFNSVVVTSVAAGEIRATGVYNGPTGGRIRFESDAKFRGSSNPLGMTKLEVKSPSLEFESTSYEWLVVSGPNAQIRGTGRANGTNVGFLVTITDGQQPGGGGTDRFRIRIWNASTSATIYDTVPGAPDDIDTAAPMAIVGGNVQIIR